MTIIGNVIVIIRQKSSQNSYSLIKRVTSERVGFVYVYLVIGVLRSNVLPFSQEIRVYHPEWMFWVLFRGNRTK